MFSWLRSLFSGGLSKTEAPPRLDLFDPKERMIYEHMYGYNAAGEKVFVRKDPMALWQRVTEQQASIDADIKVARSPSRAAAERYAALCLKLRGIFQIPPFDQGGLPDALLLQLLGHFLAYTDSLKKNSPQTSTSATATLSATPNTSESAPAGKSDTPSTSGSTSTAAGGCTASPTPSGLG